MSNATELNNLIELKHLFSLVSDLCFFIGSFCLGYLVGSGK